jgi:saccharopine dehydrogenase-like NADP-dependent oxidoreductase
MKAIILGAGLVGKAMALDLASDPEFKLTVVDIKKEPLEQLATGMMSVEQKDLSRPEQVKKAVKSYELVINALPGFMGYQTLKACLEAGKNVIDIAFFPEDPFELDSLAMEKGVAAVVDCGVAPGLSHMLTACGLSQLDKGRSLTIYVGGLPAVRQWPFEYKAVFSPYDVIEEYLRPARFKENGHLVVKPALSDAEFIEFEKLGTLEAFNTDGLRTLLRTLDLPDMKEKTLRYPGHREKMAILREAGFFESGPVEISGHKIRPIDLTARVLFSRLMLKPGEEDVTVLRVIISGEKKGTCQTIIFDLFDRFDPKSGIHSMARTTGYTATMVARAMAKGLIRKTGIIPPELLGFQPECMRFVLDGLENRGITIKEKINEK